MSRYIDADAFLKEYCEPYPHVYMAMSKAVADAPSIDIVRCKECKHNPWNYNDDAPIDYTCVWDDGFADSRPQTPDDFCSYGEREGV